MQVQENGNALEGTDHVTQTSNGWFDGAEDVMTVYLHRVKEGRERLIEGFDISPADTSFYEFQLDVKRMYGGGPYVAVIRGERGQFGKRLPFVLEGLPKPQPGEGREEAPRESEASGIADMLLKMQESNDRKFELLAEKIAARPAADTDPMAMLDRALSIVGKTQGREPQKSLFEMVQEAKAVQELLGGGGGDENWVMDLAKEFGPMFLAGMSAKDAPAKNTGGQVVEAEAPAAPTPQQRQNNAIARVRMLLAGLVELAGFGVPPEKTLDRVKEQAGDDWPTLLQLVQRPDALQLAEQLVPTVKNNREWFAAWRDVVLGVSVKNGTTRRPAAKQPAKPAVKPAAGKAVQAGGRPARSKANA